ncbi:hypothetical protein SLOPH_481 [Spraguea lophii 42_110]|uniref:Uncharacterized protein n=1 Tax=Spraguea lophii (strain 42_110) TaxID=1358809 RepID=S7XQS1_SPRLO|nr:hypothetical protein SLOPH_481 [Spraguea lophii 42_110]
MYFLQIYIFIFIKIYLNTSPMFTRLENIKNKKEIYSFGKIILKRKNYYVLEENRSKVILKSIKPLIENRYIRFYGIKNSKYINVIFSEELNIDINLLKKINNK